MRLGQTISRGGLDMVGEVYQRYQLLDRYVRDVSFRAEAKCEVWVKVLSPKCAKRST